MNFDKITEYLDSLLTKDIPSVDCIIYDNHKEIYRHMDGKTDFEKTVAVSDDTQYLMFSMTKVLTMTCMVQLIEKGLVSLEDEVSKFLPAYRNLKVEENGKIIDAKTPLKIKYLLSMQSGLDYDLERPGIKRVLKEKGMSATTREIVDSFAESPLKFNPGTRYLYSLSHDVAAAIIEVVSGMSFGEYLRKNVLEPLKMDRTFFAKPMNGDVKNLASQYIWDEASGKSVPMEASCCYQLSECYESGGAGLISCTADYAKLADTLACGGISKDGVRILKPESVEMIKVNQLCDASMEDIRKNMGRYGYGYGLGMQVFVDPSEVNSTAPAGIFGWDGAAGSCIQMDTKSGLSFVFTMHVRGCGPAYGEYHPTLRDLIFS